MTNPVPGAAVGTPYGKRGPYWSCNRDSSGNGIHTGVDYPANVGTKVVAARPGTAVYCNHGSAFGYHQLEIRCGDGTRDFYAHMPKRTVADGSKVSAGQQVGTVGAEGNVTGPHLHFERHATETGGWSCSVVRDPAPSINYAASGSGGSGSGSGEDDMPLNESDLSAIAKRVNQVLGDFTASGDKRDAKAKNPEQANARLSQIETVVRDIQQRVKNLEKN